MFILRYHGQYMTESRKKIAIAATAAVLVLGLLWYFQQQGLVKVFPTSEDREIKRLLRIDRSKYEPATGLTNEQFEEAIRVLEERKLAVEANPTDAQAWFLFGFSLDFLNDKEQASAVWEKAFALQPLNFVTAVNLANNYQYFLKNLEKAEFYYGKALEVRPDYTSAYQGLIDLYRFNWKEKQNHFEPLVLEAIKSDPANKLSYYTSLTEFFAGIDPAYAQKYLAEVKVLSDKVYRDLLETYPQLKQ